MELVNQNNSSTLPLVLTDETGNAINIEIRPDGYVNATKLCQAIGKEWKNYYKSSGTGCFLEELSKYEKIPVAFRPVPFGAGQISPRTGTGALVHIGISRTQNTWVHPDVAIHLAQWASPRFGVAVSRLVRRYQMGQVTTQESINASVDLAQTLSTVDEEPGGDVVPAIEAGWLQTRMDSIHVTKVRNGVVKSTLRSGGAIADYANLANISNQLALNFQGTTKRFKSEHHIPQKYSLPDVMNKNALARRVIAECGMGAHLLCNSEALAAMTLKERNESYQKRKDEIKVACDILIIGAPGLIPVSEADEKKKSLMLKRKTGEIEPSYEARSLLVVA